jgi:hypothetical protein
MIRYEKSLKSGNGPELSITTSAALVTHQMQAVLATDQDEFRYAIGHPFSKPSGK